MRATTIAEIRKRIEHYRFSATRRTGYPEYRGPHSALTRYHSAQSIYEKIRDLEWVLDMEGSTEKQIPESATEVETKIRDRVKKIEEKLRAGEGTAEARRIRRTEMKTLCNVLLMMAGHKGVGGMTYE